MKGQNCPVFSGLGAQPLIVAINPERGRLGGVGALSGPTAAGGSWK